MSQCNNNSTNMPDTSLNGHDTLKLDIGTHSDTPFVRKFETERHKYVYDVNTMAIVKVDSVVWDIISDVGSLNKEVMVSKYSSCHSEDDILLALDEIVTAQNTRGLFLSHYPDIEMPLRDECIQHRLEHERMILLLNVTEECNFRCSYCVFNGQLPNRRTHSGRQMSWSVAKRAIDDFLEHSTGVEERSITFYGGEPLLNFALIQRCFQYVKERATGATPSFGMTTNGSLLKGDIADCVASENCNVNVSLDGPKAIHDRCRVTRNGSPTWEEVVGNVRAFRKQHPHYKGSLGFAVTMMPSVDVNELEDFFLRSGLVSEGTTVLMNMADGIEWTEDDMAHRHETMLKLKCKFVRNLVEGKVCNSPTSPEYVVQRFLCEEPFLVFHRRHEFDRDGSSMKRGLPDRFCTLSTCIPGARRTFVTVDGDYLPCERVPETDYMKIGSVTEGFDIPHIRRLLEEWVNRTKKECKYCWCLPTCRVGCWATARDIETTGDSKLALCASHQGAALEMMKEYCWILERNPHALDYMKDVKML